MNSNKPYLLRALYDWINDNQLTPYVLIDANVGDMDIPRDFIEDGKIVLNISASAACDLDLSKDYISFKARFSGKSMNVYFPNHAVLAIYAKENGRGMVFPEENEEVTDADDTVFNSDIEQRVENRKEKKKDRSHLKLIK
jgi:stringent starvation protein B|tara:strand:+ start:224 stop:643 length:420 start_codon:yes stop_codon:yes gene_type:complete